MTIEGMLKSQLETERRAAEIREDVVRDLLNRVDGLKQELINTKKTLDMALAKINSAKTVLGG